MKTYRIETLSYKGFDTLVRPEIDVADESVLFESESKQEAWNEWDKLKCKYNEAREFNKNSGFALYEIDEEENDCDQLAEWNKYRSEHLIEATMLEARLSIKGASEAIGCPYRTMQSWVDGSRKCPDWCERLVVEELKRKRI